MNAQSCGRRAPSALWLLVALPALVAGGCTKILGDFTLTGGTKPPADAGKDAGPVDILVTPEDGLQTTEWGSRASFTIVLRTPPRNNVAIALSTLPLEEGSVSPEGVTFTPSNWNAPQTVYVTGKQDDFLDGNTIYTVVTSPASSEDPHYKDMDPADVAVLNVDDETPGFSITPLTGLTTSEQRSSATFTVALNAPPTDVVTIDLTSSLPREAKVSPANLAFSPSNFRSPQTVTVTGVDDTDTDGPRMVSIVTAPAKSPDKSYDGLNPPDVQVVNLDDETAGITVTPLTGRTTSENLQTAGFAVSLDAPPTADVTVALASSNTKEGTVLPAQLKFTAANWRAPQTFTVTGVDDSEVDGNQPYKITLAKLESADSRYSAIDPADIDLLNVDNDSAGVIVTPDEGLTTSEDGLSATFSVMLAKPPNSDVTLDFATSAPAESALNPRRITFTSRNWNAPQIITVTGLDDTAIDGDVAYHVNGKVDVGNSDPDYGVLPEVDVMLVNLDNETPGIRILPHDFLSTTEGGGKTSFSIALRSRPKSDVRIDLSSGMPTEGTAFPSSLVFTPANFAAPQKVTVVGQDDMAKDGAQPYLVITEPAVSNDDAYNGLDAPDVAVVNHDDDTPGVVVLKTGELVTTESGGTATFSLRLATQPKNDVAINVFSSNAGEGEVVPGAVTFTPDNWASPQAVTLIGTNDSVVDGAHTYRIIIAGTNSSDLDYQGIDVDDLVATNLDDETAAVVVTADAPLITTENGGTATFSVALGSPPMREVRVSLSTNRPGEASVNPAQMVFTSANWRSPQVVTVTGLDDGAVADGNQPYSIVFTRTSSLDSAYNNLQPPDVTAVNLDDDSPGVHVVAARGLATSEGGGTASFTVVLNSKPSADVAIAVRSTLPTEGTPNTSRLTFTTANWSSPQTVTVTGMEDMVVDGSRPYSIVLDATMGGDAVYSAIDPADVDLVNLDNDAPRIQVIAPKIATTTEFGGTTTFGVVLAAAPSETVNVPIISSNTGEGNPNRSTLKFTTANWATPQWVTVSGADDAVPTADGDATYRIAVGPATGGNYQGRRGADVSLVNIDNDSPGILVGAPLGSTTEGGIATYFTVSLAMKPTSNVTIPIASTRPTEGTPLAASLVFTPVNWNAPQTVAVRGVNDMVVDGDQIYRMIVGPSTSGDANDSGDPNYKGRKGNDVVLTNLDDDGAAIRVIAAPDLRTTEAGGTAKFTVVLATAPTDVVTVPLASRSMNEGRVSDPMSGSLVFTPMNWSIAQTVTVTGVDDMLGDGNVPYAIRFAPSTSGDMRYVGRTANDVFLTNIDDDSAGVTITAPPNLTTSEAGGTPTTFTIVLNKAPSAGVSFGIRSSNTDEGTVSPGFIQFSTDNWNVPQTVTVTGVQDTVADGNQVYAVIIEPAQSSDMDYGNLLVDPVVVTNLDDEMPAMLGKHRPAVRQQRPAVSGHVR